MNKKFWALVAAAFVAGFIIFIGLRMILVEDHHVHYHANFGLFVNGQRDKFDNFTFYEEIAACNDHTTQDPKHNIHMHDNVNDVVHVHAEAATWGAFFANLGYTLGNKVLVTDKGVFVDGRDGKRLQFILNGKPVETVQDRVIGSTDALLISYGSEDSSGLEAQYKQIDHSADHYNKTADPAACSGSEELNLTTRFKRAFNFSN